jgi:murein DD-endopeptidase MepM/ murein hydrolase activator NlpD
MLILHRVNQVRQTLSAYKELLIKSMPIPFARQRHKAHKKVQAAMAMLAIGTLLLVALPGRALQVQVSPSKLQLGDTLSVTIEADTSTNAAPTVTLGKRASNAFPVSKQRFRALLPTTPLDKPGTLQLQVQSGSETRSMAIPLRARKFPTQSIWLPPGKDQDLSDFEFNRVDAFKKLVTPQKFWSGPFLKPNNGPITTIYGVRRYYNGKFANDYYHRGVDYAGAYGSPIIAPAAGKVALIGQEAKGFVIHGNCIGIDHGQGVESIFLHLSRILVKDGEFVKAGQVIGALGGTGAATGPHLHWGLYVNGQAVDPSPWRKQGFE